MRNSPLLFDSHGVSLVGDLYMPLDGAKGVVVTTGPLTSVKEQAAGVYAAAMAKLGYVAVAFDHTGFGDSGGQPRQLENPYAKAQDVSAALDAIYALPDLAGLPAIGIGVCAGGGYMAQAVVNDQRFSMFAGVAGVYAKAAQMKASMGDGYTAAKTRAQEAKARFERTGEVETIAAVSQAGDDVAMPLAEAFAYYGTSRGQVANYVNGFAVQSRLYTLDFDVQGLAPRITAPSFIVHSEKALAPGWAKAFFGELGGTHEALWLTSEGQIDFYDDPSLIAAATRGIDHFAQKQGIV